MTSYLEIKQNLGKIVKRDDPQNPLILLQRPKDFGNGFLAERFFPVEQVGTASGLEPVDDEFIGGGGNGDDGLAQVPELTLSMVTS